MGSVYTYILLLYIILHHVLYFSKDKTISMQSLYYISAINVSFFRYFRENNTLFLHSYSTAQAALRPPAALYQAPDRVTRPGHRSLLLRPVSAVLYIALAPSRRRQATRAAEWTLFEEKPGG